MRRSPCSLLPGLMLFAIGLAAQAAPHRSMGWTPPPVAAAATPVASGAAAAASAPAASSVRAAR